MKLLHQIPSWLKNKYFLTAAGFTVWISFFDDRDLATSMKHKRELKSLQERCSFYEGQIDDTRKELEALKFDPAILEKYAREKYRMKKENEDLFIVPEKDAD